MKNKKIEKIKITFLTNNSSETPEDLDKMQLIGMHKTYIKEHLCRKNNGNCSHVCLLSNNPSSYVSLKLFQLIQLF